MAGFQFHGGIDLGKTEVQNPLFHKSASDIASPIEGQFYYNTGTKKPRWYDGTAWQEVGTGTVIGSAAAGRVTFWSAAGTISSSTSFLWNGTALGVGLAPESGTSIQASTLIRSGSTGGNRLDMYNDSILHTWVSDASGQNRFGLYGNIGGLISGTDGGGIAFRTSASGGGIGYIYARNTNYMVARFNSTDLMFFHSNGRVGVKTSAPGYDLDIAGTCRVQGQFLPFGDVGFGTTSPECKVNIQGGFLRIGTSASGHNMEFANPSLDTIQYSFGSSMRYRITGNAGNEGFAGADGGVVRLQNGNAAHILHIYAGGSGTYIAHNSVTRIKFTATSQNIYGFTQLISGGNTSATFGLVVMDSGANPVNAAIAVRDDGKIAFGHNAPTARIHIYGGSAAAGTAPLKFFSGVLMTAPESGAVEWDGSRLYITQTTGPTRKNIAYLDETFIQGGNAFGATAAIGSTDNFAMTFRTNNVVRMQLNTLGALNMTQLSSDPATLADGDTWHNSTDQRVKHRFNSVTRSVAYVDDLLNSDTVIVREDFIKTNNLPSLWLYSGDSSTLNSVNYAYGFGSFAVSTDTTGASTNGFACLRQDADLQASTANRTYTMIAQVDLSATYIPTTTNAGEIWIGFGGGNMTSITSPDDFVGFRVNGSDATHGRYGLTVRKNGTSTASNTGNITPGIKTLKIVWTNTSVAFYEDDVLLLNQTTLTNSPTGESPLGMMVKSVSSVSSVLPVGCVVCSLICKIEK